MRRVPQVLVRLGLFAVAVLALAGCGGPVTPVPSTPPSSPASEVPPTVGTAGSDGLTVRYLSGDGTVKTLRVEDFPR